MFKIIHNLTRLDKILVIFLASVFFLTSVHLTWAFYLDNTQVLPADGGIYAEGLVGEIKLINPVFANRNPIDADISNLVFSGLMKYDVKINQIIDDLADHTLSYDKKTYTFIVKEGILFHDGTALTADDIVFTFKEIIQNPDFKNEILRREFEGIEIEKVDSRTVNFILPKPYKFFLTNLTVGILPKHLLFDVPVGELDQAHFNQYPIGSGPYKFDQIMINNNSVDIMLKQFDNYYGNKPHITGLLLKVYPDYASLIKNLDVLNGVRSVPKDQILKFPSQSRFEIVKYHLPQYVALFLNTSSDILKDEKIRLSLQLATNRTKIAELMQEDLIIDDPLMEIKKQDWIFQYDLEKAAGGLYDAGWNLPNKKTEEEKKTESSEKSAKVMPIEENLLTQLVNLFTVNEVYAAVKYITSPNRGEDFITTEDPLFITGTVPIGTQAVFVNNYGLKKFEAGNTTWSYKASTEISTMRLGENLYEVFTVDDAGNKSKVDQIKITLNPKPEKTEPVVAVIPKADEEVKPVEVKKEPVVKEEEKPKETTLVVENKTDENVVKNQTGSEVIEKNEEQPIIEKKPVAPQKKKLSNVRVNKDGEKLELSLITSSKPEFYREIAEEVKAEWSEVGVDLQIEVLESEDFQKRVRERDYDVLLYGQSLGYNLDAYSYWHSSQAGEKGLNLSNYASFESDSLMEEVRSTHNEDRRKATLEKLGKTMSQDVPAIFLYRPVYYLVFDKKVNNVLMNDLPNISERFSNIDEWYLKEDRFFEENRGWSDFFSWSIQNTWGFN